VLKTPGARGIPGVEHLRCDDVSSNREAGVQRVRWGWVIGCFTGGTALTVLALWLEDRWSWQGVFPSVLVNVGSAFGLAGALFLLERRFTRTVIRVSERTIRQAAQQLEERLQERTDRLTARIEDLQAQVDQRMRRRAGEQDAKITALDDNVSYATVTEAMAEANRLAAIDNGKVAVHASADPDGLGLIFEWGTDYQEFHAYDGELLQPQPPRPYLHIKARIEADREQHGSPPSIEVEWRPDDAAADIAEKLITELQTAGRWHGQGTLDWTLALRNLARSLDTAISSRRRDQGAWHLHGSLIELVGDDWAITTVGLECPRHDYLLPAAEFPTIIDERNNELAGRDWSPPDPPAWADYGEWSRVIRRCKREFRMRRLSFESGSWNPGARMSERRH
jgi:hypothetical protein